MSDSPNLAFDNSYAQLPEAFFSRLPPTPVAAPRLVRLNHSLAAELGLDPAYLATSEGVDVLAGNRVPDGAAPLAMAYAGFQFGNWVPQLGDGRAILLGELIDQQGVRRDIQLKGSGPTPFSRRGDGRAALGPVLREYIVSEAMAALGIPTTRALAAVTTGESIMRETQLPGAVLTRVARSHVRVGTFQFFAGRRDTAAIRTLADYVIARHHPALAQAADPYLALLSTTMDLQAELVAQWLGVGFIHGVMNTDNMSIIGETIDYGPCAFMDAYHPDTVFSSIDRNGRYAYGNQPAIAHWNLAGLAQALLPILGDGDSDGNDGNAVIDEVNSLLQRFPERFETLHHTRLRRKLGLREQRPGDEVLCQDLLTRMASNGADFTLTFRRLCNAVEQRPDHEQSSDQSVQALFDDPQAFNAWAAQWRNRLSGEQRSAAERRQDMLGVNPAYIPRNHLVEEAIEAAVRHQDFTPFEHLIEVLSTPFTDQPARAKYAAPPRPDQVVQATFCGT